jgi:ATP-dependent Lhr-like helicase
VFRSRGPTGALLSRTQRGSATRSALRCRTAFRGLHRASDQPLDDLIAATPARTDLSWRPPSPIVSASPPRWCADRSNARRGRARARRVPAGGFEREWCDADVLRRIRRRSLAALRREIEPVDAAAFARFLPAWQAADRPRGPDALTQALERLEGSRHPASILERDVLPARVLGFRPADLDALTSSGDLVWAGAGALGADDGRVTLLFRDRAAALSRAGDPPAGAAHDAIRVTSPIAGIVLARARPGRGDRRSGRVAACSVGPRVGGRGHERHARPLRAFARSGRRARERPPDRPGARVTRGRRGRRTVVARGRSRVPDDQPDRARRCACRTTPRSIRRRDP